LGEKQLEGSDVIQVRKDAALDPRSSSGKFLVMGPKAGLVGGRKRELDSRSQGSVLHLTSLGL
jgi:hypothetical protein